MGSTGRSRREAVARAVSRRAPRPDAPVPAPSTLAHVRRPGGPSGLRVTLAMLRDRTPRTTLLESVARRHGPVTHYRMAGEHVYLVSGPDVVTDVFLGHSRDLMKGRGLQAARPLIGNGLLTSEGEFHMRQRRLTQPAFHRGRLPSYAGQMVAETLRHEAGWRDGDRVDMVEEMTALTLAVVGRTLFGTDLTGDARTFAETLAELLSGFGQLSALGNERLVRLLPSGRHLLARVDDLDVVVARIIDEHRADLGAGAERDDLLTWLIEARDDEGADRFGASMTDDQLRDEVMTLVLAGHETTAMALSWAWWLLSCHPDAAARLHDELASVLGQGEGRRAPAYDDLPSLAWTHAVVAETIRLYPPAWIMGRRLLTDLRVGGWDVPSGSIVLVSPWVQHRDPAHWDRASSFAPERWLDSAGKYDESAPGVPRGSWIPFGFGNRRCIGEQFAWTEAVLVLAVLAGRWSPELVPGTAVGMQAAVTLRPRDGLPMVLRERRAGAGG